MAFGLAVGLFMVVLFFVVAQPRGLSVGWPAAIGGGLALVLGIVTWRDVLQVASIVWDATLAFVAIVLISLILDAVGFFRWAALEMAHRAGTSGLKLFFLVGLLGAMVAMFFANDGAALILTPLVYEEAKVLKMNAGATLAFIMASGFIADTTSLPLVVSNLVNIVSADYFHWGFVSYAVRMIPVDIVSLAASLFFLWLYFRRSIPASIDTNDLEDPSTAIADPRVFRVAWYVLGLLLAGYLVSQLFHWPVSAVAGGAALLLMGAAWQSPSVSVKRIVWEAPWNIVVFSLGMYVVVFGLNDVGLIHALSRVLDRMAHVGLWPAVVGAGFVSAVVSAIVNNMPAVLINALAIHQAAGDLTVRTAMAYANVVGSDLGPKMTPIGSLATLLWLHVLKRRGLTISWAYYVRVGLVLTIPVLLVTLTGLWAWSALAG